NGENAGGAASEEIFFPPRQSRRFISPKLLASANSAQLGFSGDVAGFANVADFAAPELEHVRVAWFGMESINDPEKLRYYVERVFTGVPSEQVQIFRPFTNSVFSPEMLNEASFAVIAQNLAPEEIAPVRDWLDHGK